MCSRRRSHRQAKLMPKRDLKSKTGKKQRNQRMQIKQSVCGVFIILSSPLKSPNSCRRTESGGRGGGRSWSCGAVPWCGRRWGETKDMIPVSVVTQVVLGDQASCVCCGITEIHFVSITSRRRGTKRKPTPQQIPPFRKTLSSYKKDFQKKKRTVKAPGSFVFVFNF